MSGFTVNSDFESCRYCERKNIAIRKEAFINSRNFGIFSPENFPKLTNGYLNIKNFNLWEAGPMIPTKSSSGGYNIRKRSSGKVTNALAAHLSFPCNNSATEAIADPSSAIHYHVNHAKEIATFTVDESLPVEFCRNTSLHGLKYIGLKKTHFSEKVFWMLAFTLGIVMAAWMISAVWQKYKRNPVIVSFQPFETKTNEIPFPAITICNMNRILMSKAESFMRKARGSNKLNDVKDDQEYVVYLDHVCSGSISFSKRFNYSCNRGNVPDSLLNQISADKNNSDVDTINVMKFLDDSSQTCADMIPLCIWQDELTNCTELFSYGNTDYGKCCTFNMMPKQLLYRSPSYNEDESSDELQDWKDWQWDGDSLLNRQPTINTDFPRRQKLPGKTFGLSLLLNPDLHEYFCTTSDSIGFRLLAHSPIEIPRVVDFGSAIPPNSEVFINVKPTVTVADDKIQGFTLEQRQCYFSDEYKLNFYAYYTPTNCLMECIANVTFRRCNCAPYYMPRDATRNLCTRSQFKCAGNIKKEMIQQGYNSLCQQCRPSCTEIKYLTELTTVPLQDPQQLWENGSSHIPKWSRSNASIVHIYFGDETTTARLRTELYGLTDLLANFGGLMGLCLGFSGLSLIEIFYFLTVRAYCKRRSDKLENAETEMKQPKDSRQSNIPEELM